MTVDNFTTVRSVYKALDGFAPFSLAQNDDNVGLLVGDFDEKVSRILLSLDITNDVVCEAVERGAELIISHHPVIYHPLKSLNNGNPAVLAAKNGISAICAHTNLDVARGGVNDRLAAMISAKKTDKYLEELPKNSANTDKYGFGNICILPKEMSAGEFANLLKSTLLCTVVRYSDSSKPIRRVAICSGSGGFLVTEAIAAEVDALLCGDVKHDQFIKARNADFALFDAGHYHTEQIILSVLERMLREKFPEITVKIAQKSADPVSYI